MPHVFTRVLTFRCGAERNARKELSGPWHIFIGLRALKVTADIQSESFTSAGSQEFFLRRLRAGRCLTRVAFRFQSSLQVERGSERPRANLVLTEWCSVCDGNLNSSRSPPGTGPGRRNPSPSMRSCSRFWRYELRTSHHTVNTSDTHYNSNSISYFLFIHTTFLFKKKFSFAF